MSKPSNEFCRWWQEHQHSGFCEDSNGHGHWGISPREAWACDRYRREFSDAGGEPYCNEFFETSAPNLWMEYDDTAQAKAAAQLAEFLESRKVGIVATEIKAESNP